MVPRASATLASQRVGPPGGKKLRKVVKLPALGDAAQMTSTPHGDTFVNVDAGLAMLRTRGRGRRGHAASTQDPWPEKHGLSLKRYRGRAGDDTHRGRDLAR